MARLGLISVLRVLRGMKVPKVGAEGKGRREDEGRRPVRSVAPPPSIGLP